MSDKLKTYEKKMPNFIIDYFEKIIDEYEKLKMKYKNNLSKS